jgi:formylglycine-generating enzyme required for sulfatase activity/catechol 2,3-dioxygenase-like lactoylglutathione lyase family enzyme
MKNECIIALAFLTLSSAPAFAEVVTIRDCDYCPEMVVIAPGEFWMGSTPESLQRPFLEADRVTVEQPRQAVTIGYEFAIAKTELTVDEFAAFVTDSAYQASECLSYDFAASRWMLNGHDWSDPGFPQAGDHPAVCLSWEDARAYVDWLSVKTGQRYRLPSEAEWEYAARAGTQTLWPWGDEKDLACEYSNSSDRAGLAAGVSSAQAGIFDCDDGYVHTAPADFGEPNAFGLHGMIGNAGEWQNDCMVRTLEGAPADGSARAVPGCIERVMRGGSWFNPPLYSRPAFRYGTLQNQAFTLVGFRPVREMEAESAAKQLPDPRARIKRLAIQVPDIDRAVVFYRDVIGFTIEMQGVIRAGDEPYLHRVFNSDPDTTVRRVLFSTGTEKRGLFVVENKQMSFPDPGEVRVFAAVIEVSDLLEVKKRAASAGFNTLDHQVSQTSDGKAFAEMIIDGPGGHAVLAFQYDFGTED